MANIIEVIINITKRGSARDAVREAEAFNKQLSLLEGNTESYHKELARVVEEQGALEEGLTKSGKAASKLRDSVSGRFISEGDANEQLGFFDKLDAKSRILTESFKRLRDQGRFLSREEIFDPNNIVDRVLREHVPGELPGGTSGRVLTDQRLRQGDAASPLTEEDVSLFKRIDDEAVQIRRNAEEANHAFDSWGDNIGDARTNLSGMKREIDRIANASAKQAASFDRANQLGFGDADNSVREISKLRKALTGLEADLGRVQNAQRSVGDDIFGGIEDALRKESIALKKNGDVRSTVFANAANDVQRVRNLPTPFDPEKLAASTRGLRLVKEGIIELGDEEDRLSSVERNLERRIHLTNRRFSDRQGIVGTLERLSGRLGSGIFRGAIAAAEKLKVTEDQVADAAEKARRGIDDINPVDDTVAIGFSRIARFLAVVVAVLPLLTVGLGSALGAVTALVGGVTALIASLSTLSGVLATLPAALAAVAGAALALKTVFGPSFRTISDRVTEIINAQNLARRNAKKTDDEVRRAQLALIDQRRTGALQELNLEEQIKDVRITNANQVRDAEEDLHLLRIHNRERERDIEQNIIDARIAAADKLKSAEERLAQIRKQNALRQRELEQDLANARAELAGLQVEGASPQSIAAARARVNEAKGVLDNFKVSDDKRREKDAERDLARVRRENARDIARLQEQLRRAKRDDHAEEQRAEVRLHRLRRDNIQQLLRLERQLKEARINNAHQIENAEAGVKEARNRAAGALGNPLAGLDPIQKQIVLGIIRIKDEWKKLTAATRLSGEAFGLKVLLLVEKHLPAIAALVDRFARVLLKLAKEALDRFTEPGKMEQLLGVFEDGLFILDKFGGFLIDIADAMLTIADRARPLTRALGTFIERIGKSARSGADRAARRPGAPSPEDVRFGGTNAGQQQSELDKFFAATARVAALLGKALGSLARAFKNILTVAEPFGEKILRDFGAWADRVEAFTESPKGQKALFTFFKEATPVFEKLVDLGADFVKTLFLIGRDLLRTGDGKKNFLTGLIEGLDKGLPSFRKFVVETTQKNGPALIRFIREFGKAIGTLIGPGGPFTTLLRVVGNILAVFDQFPAPLRKVVLTFLTLGAVASGAVRLLGGMRKGIELLVAKLVVLSRGGAEAGAFLPGFAGVLRVVFLLLLAFPGLLGTINDLLHTLAGIISPVTNALSKFLSLIGIGEGAQGQIAGAALNILFFRKHFIALFKDFKAFASLSRSEGFFAALSAQFPNASKLLSDFRLKLATLTTAVSQSKLGAGLRNLGGLLGKFGTALKAAGVAALDFSRKSLVALVQATRRAFAAMLLATRAWLAEMTVALATNPVGLAILGILALVAILVTLQLKFHAVSNSLRFLGERFKAFGRALIEAFTHPLRFLQDHWKTLLALALLGPLGPLYALFSKQFNKIGKAIIDGLKKGLASATSFFTNFGHWLYDHLVRPVLQVFGISSPSTLMFKIGKDIIQGLINGVLSLGSSIVNLGKKVVGLFLDGIKDFPGELRDIGVFLVDGIISGIKGSAGKLKDAAGWLKDKLLGGLKSVFSIFSPSRVMALEVGEPLAEGVISGFKTGITPLTAQMTQAIQRSISAIVAQVRASKARVQSAFASVTDFALQSFDAQRGQELTPSERKLKAIQDARDKRQRVGAVTSAQRSLAEAQAAERAARAKIATAERLEKIADREQKEGNKNLAKIHRRQAAALRTEGTQGLSEAQKQEAESQQTLEDAKTEITVAALTKRAEAERRERDKQNEIRRRNFEGELTKLKEQLATGKLTAAQAQDRLIALFHKYKVPFKDSGKLLGNAFVDGFVSAFGTLLRRVTRLLNRTRALARAEKRRQDAGGQALAETVLPPGLRPAPPSGVGRGNADDEKKDVDAFIKRHPGHRRLVQVLNKVGIQLTLPKKLDNSGLLKAAKSILTRFGIQALEAVLRALGVRGYAKGGLIPGIIGKAVPILAHAGEWVVNPRQQQIAAKLAGTTPTRLREQLFNRTQLVPKRSFAEGGVVLAPTTASSAAKEPGTTVNQTVTVNTASERADVDYIARVLERRMQTL